ncbi:MAG: NAD+ synthase [Phycisphaeraceae bacterium]|nr:NAD+ synthase [Phycisphaeraceae bacterium]MCW5762133.1 NAD+ synthase [Phycisphaeraceae bacterium]
MKIALVQVNPTVGDIAGNGRLIEGAIAAGRGMGADVVVVPELAVSGYPPKDLLLQRGFVAACAAEVKRIGERCTAGIAAVIGTPLPVEGDGDRAGGIANSVVVYRDGAMVDYYDKRLLPTYDVFDEDRYFAAGDRAVVVDIAGVKVGLAICEDLWRGEDAGFASRYRGAADPVEEAARAGAEVLVVPSASPYVLGKHDRHVAILRMHAMRHGLSVCSVNQVGGNDELIFDGRACVVDARGAVVAQAKAFDEDVLVVEVGGSVAEAASLPADLGPEGNVVEALTLGVRDYLRKTGFRKAVIGLSGGIDSAVTAAIAVKALGAENVLGVAMPSVYSSGHSVEDALELAARLGMRCEVAAIEGGHAALRAAVDPVFGAIGERKLGERLPDVADENLQSRVRGTMLMTVSNRTGAMVLTTGNKSELAVGYCTLYGDMNGGLAVLSDVPKTMVYRIARWMNERWRECGFGGEPIPQRSIDKPPSAELAPGQVDADSLPAYEVLDAIVEMHVEQRLNAAEIVERTGFGAELVERLVRLMDRNEYKRKQAATGLKVTGVAFGSGRRMPIARGWW